MLQQPVAPTTWQSLSTAPQTVRLAAACRHRMQASGGQRAAPLSADVPATNDPISQHDDSLSPSRQAAVCQPCCSRPATECSGQYQQRQLLRLLLRRHHQQQYQQVRLTYLLDSQSYGKPYVAGASATSVVALQLPLMPHQWARGQHRYP